MNYKKKVLSLILLVGIINGGIGIPFLSLAQQTRAAIPETTEEATEVGKGILQRLPEAIGKVWKDEVAPAWKKLWGGIGEFFQKIWQGITRIFKKTVEERKPILKEELKEEKEEVKQDLETETLKTTKNLWERFKGLLR